MADLAQRPWMDADGRVWQDREHGSNMTLLDHMEAMTGIRLGDANPYAVRPRRDVTQVQRPVVLGDPDFPHIAPVAVPAGTARTAELLARQAGIPTSASHQEQHAAAVREHDRQAARYRGPRHADYQDHTAPRRRAVQLVNYGDEPWNGSLQVLTLAGAA
jgi:hypothetical protein